MNLPNIITILGARPQFIKAAALSRYISEVVQQNILHTGQHYDYLMSEALFTQLELPKPAWHLDCRARTQSTMTAKMLEGIEPILEAQRPKAVLVYGDTNSTLAGALAASKLHIPIWHVESGVRSFNKKMPEEINRILTDRIADVHFAPSRIACENLLNEGISELSIHEVGDVMYDLYLASQPKAKKITLPFSDNFLLLTLHRAENFQKEEDINKLFVGINEIAKEYPIVFPVHPRVEKILQQGSFSLSSNIFLHPPLNYFEMLYVLEHCQAVLTDSGGLQKEAFYASKLCVTLREETEWMELVESGWNLLVPALQLYDDRKSVLNFLAADFSKKVKPDFYGTGSACYKIKEILQDLV